MDYEQIFHSSVFYVIGLISACIFFFLFHVFRLRGYKNIARDILHKAEMDAEMLKKNNEVFLQRREIELQNKMEKNWMKKHKEALSEEYRLKKYKSGIEDQVRLSKKKSLEIEKLESRLLQQKKDLEEREKLLKTKYETLQLQLEKISQLSRREAKNLLLTQVESEIKSDLANLTQKVRLENEKNMQEEANKIISTVINRLSSSCVSEATISTISLPNEEMKGRIIGREGRNIRTLEKATGINVIIDDTPCAVVISGFDPIRKEIAKTALSELVSDGRIHPTNIEKAVFNAQASIEKQIKEAGENAALKIGIFNLSPKLVSLLGKLNYRYSYGQNILKHSLEVSYIMGIMAAELGLDIHLAKRIGLLHDIGKSVSHEVEGSHAIIGHDIAIKYGESNLVANGIGSHHNEMPPISIEGCLCSAADSISASRPGARIEAVEEYIHRIQKLEEIAMNFPGVEKVYAMQAGREVRVMVRPEEIYDDDIINLSRKITKRIEKELNFPGRIKVTIIREKRVVEYAV